MIKSLRFSFAAAIIVALIGPTAPASANGCAGFAGGDGTSATPYLIADRANLEAIDNCLVIGKHFKQTADIDLSGPAWVPLAYDAAFEGVYDGDFFTISNMTVPSTSGMGGLFWAISGAEVRNLRFTGASVSATNQAEVAGVGHAGVLTGEIKNASVVSKVSISSSSVSGTTAGGLTGWTQGARSAISEVSVDAIVTSSNANAGGVVGQSENNSAALTNVVFSGIVTSGGSQVGGIVGYGINTEIYNVYSVGIVNGAVNHRGGIIGTLIGTSIARAYYLDSSVTSLASDYGTAKTLEDMKLIATYVAPWSITDEPNGDAVWLIDPELNVGFPMLMWEYVAYWAPCQIGTYSATGSSPCVDAPAGSFVNITGSTAAVRCPAGYFQPNTRSRECVQAEPGFYVAEEGSATQLPCPAGLSSEAAALSCFAVDLSYRGPVISSGSGLPATPGALLMLKGSNLGSVSAISIGGFKVSVASTADSITFSVPAALVPGVYDLVISSASGTLSVQGAIVISAGANSVAETVAAFTKRQAGNTVKLYAKGVVGAGKVVFMHNGSEVAWVRAVDGTDPKLTVNANGNYLVRTRTLLPGKNVFEIWVDGVRQSRTAYSK